jgi:hypothetical protein
MKLPLMILINALLVGLFLYWLWREYRQASPGLRRWLLPALGWRLLLTVASNSHPSPDLVGPEKWSRLLAPYFWAHPVRILPILQGVGFFIGHEAVFYYKWSSTLFYYKLFAVLSMASGGLLWLNGLYLSLLCFVGCWALVRVLSQTFPLAPTAAAGVAFLAWPTVVWWTAGLTKETLLVGAGAGVAAIVLSAIYGSRPIGYGRVIGGTLLLLVLAWLMLHVRYLFALPLLGGLLALSTVQLATRQGWLGRSWLAQASGLLLIAGLAGGTAWALGGELLSLRFFSREIAANYRHGLLTSVGRPHLEYTNWQPTPASLLQHAPLAVAQVLVRPWPGESKQPFYVGAGLENLVLAGLVGLALVGAWRGRAGHLPAGLVLLLVAYCLLLAAFIGLSTPNLGTLSRYRAAMLPWLLLLLLQNDYARGLLKKLGRWAGGR